MLNLTPGDFDVTASLTGKACAVSLSKSWQGETAQSVKARAISGGMTPVSFVCQ